LKPKLIPFAQECLKDRPNTIVQEDGAPSHAHHAQHQVYSLSKVMRLIWPGNSPDLNAIEPGWFWMKRDTTKKGAPTSKRTAEQIWVKTWWDMPQKIIQSWIERISFHIQKIIDLEGGNEYQEGKPVRFDRRTAQRRARKVQKATPEVILDDSDYETLSEEEFDPDGYLNGPDELNDGSDLRGLIL
jgi:hypothetical protein